MAAIDKVVLKMKDQGIDVDLIGLNESSGKLVEKLATYDQPHRSVSNH